MAASVEIDRIEKRYDQSVALKSVSLTTEPGEFMTLVGPSGCGKSTLLRIVAGLIPQTAGTVRIDGAAIDHLAPKARDIAMVFQSYALYPHMNVAQNIATPLRMCKLSRLARLPFIGRFAPGQADARREIAAAVKKVVEQVEIQDLLDRKPAELSGGQRQRVALARSIVRNPKVFLMDEPLSNLDARLRVSMRAEITDLHKRLGATFIYVTHDQTEAMTMSSRVAVMMDGEIIQCASPQMLYDDPTDLRVARFIGTPEINAVPADELRLCEAGQIRNLSDLPQGATVCFRPESMQVQGADGDAAIACKIERRELLGHNVLLFLRAARTNTRLTARLTAAAFAESASSCDIMMSIDPRKLLAFDSGGKRVHLKDAKKVASYAC